MLLNREVDKMSKVYVIKDGELYHAYSSGKNKNIGGRRIGNMNSSDPRLLDKIKRHLAKLWKCKVTDISVDMYHTINSVDGPAFNVSYKIRQTGTKTHSGIIPQSDL